MDGHEQTLLVTCLVEISVLKHLSHCSCNYTNRAQQTYSWAVCVCVVLCVRACVCVGVSMYESVCVQHAFVDTPCTYMLVCVYIYIYCMCVCVCVCFHGGYKCVHAGVCGYMCMHIYIFVCMVSVYQAY